MATRSSMAHLIAYVRQLIGDTSGAQFTDDAVQEALDLYREEVSREELTAVPRIIGGTVEYHRFTSYRGFWESDAEITDAAGAVVVPDVVNWLTGVFEFTASRQPPLFIHGKRYDVYGAAAEMLEQWASALAREYDFSTDGDTFRRSQQAEALLRQAAQYRTRSWMSVGVGRLERGDVVGHG